MMTLSKGTKRRLIGILTVALMVPACGKDTQHTASPAVGTNAKSTPESSSPCSGLTVPAGIQVWLDAGNISASDGAGVSTWNDCQNSGFSAVQATTTHQPTYSVSGGPNQKASVNFDGTQQYLSAGTSAIDFSSGISTILLISLADYSSDSNFRPIIYDDSLATGFTVMETQGQIAPSIGSSGATNIGSGTYAGNTWYIIGLVLNSAGTAITEYQNGEGTGIDPYPKTFSGNATNLTLFTNFSHTKFTAGKLAELMLYNASLSDTDLQTVTCYLSKKYDLGIWYCN